jgi:S1-C subfamily serine protease
MTPFQKYCANVSIVVSALLCVSLLVYGRNTPAATPSFAPSSVYIKVEDGHGSGVYIGNGLFLTAAHVAKKAQDDKLTVILNDGDELPAVVLWKNEDYDVALIRTTDTVAAQIAHLSCDARELPVGAYVETIGNPVNLKNVRTRGAVARNIAHFDKPMNAFIADLTIAPGNSGGPVFDDQGNLVGLVSAMTAVSTNAFGVSLIPLTYVVPASTICMLMGRK